MLPERDDTVHVHYEAGSVRLSGAVNQRLRISAQALIGNLVEQSSDRAIDLLSIAAGAYALDRVVRRRKTQAKNEFGGRTFKVCFHVADVAYWEGSAKDRLADLLYFLTSDVWLLSFASHDRSSFVQVQKSLELPNAERPQRLALYSGGLDSAAGLGCQLLRGQRNILLLTVGHQSTIRPRCIRQLRQLRSTLPQAATLFQASFIVHLDNAKELKEQETSQRVRGFLFCTVAALVAAAWGIHDIDLYENGPGAINLPLVAGAGSNGLSTRGAHPSFLAKMTGLASEALERELVFGLPFLWSTKASMVREIAREPKLVPWVEQSLSCVHSSLRVPVTSHCGKCPACIERRQAFVAAGIDDDRTGYKTDLMTLADPLKDDYFRGYLEDARGWMVGDPRLKQRLEDHRRLSDMEDLNTEDLTELLHRQARETIQVYGPLLVPQRGNAATARVPAAL